MADIERTIDSLEKNGFLVFRARTAADAKRVFFERLFPSIEPKTVGFGDSMSLEKTGILDELRRRKGIDFIEAWDDGPLEETLDRLRRALTADLYLAGANAVTETGELVNLDMVGNRVAGIAFGPKRVALTVGANKIVGTRIEAFRRIKTISAPLNAKRNADLKLPCQETGRCVNCGSPDRICNSWSVVERCWPRGRIAIILIDEELGL